jgi:transcriptional antiterminator RfaH
MSSKWHLVYTKAKKEAEAEHHLSNQDFHVYLPRHCVGARRKGQYTDIIQPLFPRYLFIELNEGTDNYAPIRSTRGVASLVRFGMEAAIVPPALVSYLQDNEERAMAPKRLNPFKSGDKIQVVDGPFAGYDAIYQCDRGEERALILLNIMNKFSKITLPVHNLVAEAA